MYKSLKDHLGRTVTFSDPPQRIISLCPSITETLFALNQGGKIVGRTRYCIHPAEGVSQVPIVGGTKQVDFSVIDQLRPDLIITEKEENPKEMVERLAEHYPVFVANVEDYTDALRMIADLGTIVGEGETARTIVHEIEEQFERIPSHMVCKVAYVIWRKPYMVVGNQTFIHSMLGKCGFRNVFEARGGRYPAVDVEDMKEAAPDLIFLSSEPFPFTLAHQKELKEAYPQAESMLVDGEMFSWYGVRMIQAAVYMKRLVKQINNEGKWE